MTTQKKAESLLSRSNIKEMKKSLLILKMVVILNIITVFSYITYQEVMKQRQDPMPLICKILGYDEQQNLVAVNCVKKN